MYENVKKRPQDDLPYERQVYYIIKDYRKLLKQNEVLLAKLKEMDWALNQYKSALSLKKQDFIKKNEEFVEKRREVKRLRVRIDFLEQKLLDFGIDLRDASRFL